MHFNLKVKALSADLSVSPAFREHYRVLEQNWVGISAIGFLEKIATFVKSDVFKDARMMVLFSGESPDQVFYPGSYHVETWKPSRNEPFRTFRHYHPRKGLMTLKDRFKFVQPFKDYPGIEYNAQARCLIFGFQFLKESHVQPHNLPPQLWFFTGEQDGDLDFLNRQESFIVNYYAALNMLFNYRRHDKKNMVYIPLT